MPTDFAPQLLAEINTGLIAIESRILRYGVPRAAWQINAVVQASQLQVGILVNHQLVNAAFPYTYDWEDFTNWLQMVVPEIACSLSRV